eukprot:scaffold357200_cov26-Prasinocladus_malaysianus.AAC.1
MEWNGINQGGMACDGVQMNRIGSKWVENIIDGMYWIGLDWIVKSHGWIASIALVGMPGEAQGREGRL